MVILLIIVGIGLFSIGKGISVNKVSPATKAVVNDIPYIGKIQILNGCGNKGAAHILADYLRRKQFDVKNIDNAANWNFEETLVISRIQDTSIANKVAKALSTDKMVIIRNRETSYDVTVIAGKNYRELVK